MMELQDKGLGESHTENYYLSIHSEGAYADHPFQ